MDRSLSQQTNPGQSKSKATPFHPAKYGAKWLEPTKTNTGANSRMQENDEILNGKSAIGGTEVTAHRRVASVYTKRSWPPKPTFRTYKSIEENKQNKRQSAQGLNEGSNDEVDAGKGDKEDIKSKRSGLFYDHFNEPTSFQAALSKFNGIGQSIVPPVVAKHKQQYYDSPADSYISTPSGYVSFDHPKPYVRPKYLDKNPRTEYLLPESPQDRPQSENSFFDMVKDYNRGDMKKIVDQRSPASKTMTKVLGPGLNFANSHSTTQTPSKPKSENSNSSQEHIPVSRQTSNNEVPCAALKCYSLEKNRPRQSFSHYDWQSIIFLFSDVLLATETLKRKNEMTGASKAAALTARLHSVENSPASSFENLPDINLSNNSETARTNDVIGWCPFFLNEIGGEIDDDGLCFDSSQTSNYAQMSTVSVQLMRPENSSHSVTNSPTHAQMLLVNPKGVSVLEKVGIDDDKQLNSVGFMQEYIDTGALYYKKHFFQQEHQNFLGIDEKYGPVAISIKREKLKESNANIKENSWQFRIILRASELCTLRGSVLEDVILAQPYSAARALRIRDVLEYVCPEINFDCLKLSLPNESVQQQLLKIDEQNVTNSCKIGVMYCKEGQTTEEEMYNNEFGSPALVEFLDLLGDRIQLKGFDKFRGGLDVKTNSTGKESYFTTFQNTQIMFHVSTLLPHTPVNVQQLLRKRHIGNDIVTIVFQEADSSPFSPKTIRSHFQHLFVVVRVHQPCSNRTSYRVAVSRSQDIPAFGPQIPKDALFPKSETFREFLLTKLLNGERAARSAGKFKAMSMNTRQEYLRDLALHYTTQTGIDTSQKFTRFSLTAASRRVKDRDKFKAKLTPEECSFGALIWRVILQDCGHPEGVPCMLSISDYMFCLIRESTKSIVFSIPCQAVIGWAEFSNDVMHFYYGRGERISIRASSCSSCDWKREVKKRLQTFSFGCETKSKTLRRNTKGQLGFHINYEGIVMDVEQNGYAYDIGVTQGSRLVEICKVLVVTMTHEEMVDLLRTSDVVAVILIPPLEDGTPRRCSKSLYHMSPVLKMIELEADNRNPPPRPLGEGAIHSRSKSDPASKIIKPIKSFDDITRASSYNLSQNSNQAIRNQSVVTSAASTPTLRINPLPNKKTANRFIADSVPRLRPKPYRQSLQGSSHYSGSMEFGHNHFTTMPLKKSKEKLYHDSSGMKHSTSTESGLNSYEYENVNNNNKSKRVDTFTGFLKPQSLKGLRQTSSATNSTVSTPTGSCYPLPVSASNQALKQSKETYLPQTKPRHQKQHASYQEQKIPNTSRYPSTRKGRDRIFATSNGMKHSTSTESGLNFDLSDQDSYDRMRYVTSDTYPIPARRKKLPESKPRPNGNMEKELRNFVQKKNRTEPDRQERRKKSPPVERRRAPKKQSHIQRNLIRTMSDESICGTVQNPRSWNNRTARWREPDTDLKNPIDYSTENLRRSHTLDESSGGELQYDSNYNPSGDNECYSDNDTIHGQLSDPRPATSRSPLFMLETDSSEDTYEPMVRLQPSSDANRRLLKIEEALRSLQTELAKEKKSKRKILIEVERLRKDNQRLQLRTIRKHNNFSDA